MIPLIDKAAECGAELFCLDAEWYKKGHGDWIINEEKYGEQGLEGLFAYIRNKGMIPGIWLEIECIKPDTMMAVQGRSLKRNNVAVGNTHFADFTDQWQRDYIESIIDMLYEKGARFIKNDYNSSVMLGAEMNGSSPAEGLKKHIESFYTFIDRIKKKYPDLYIENCGSGAMRCDTGTLRHFELQSTSDQEIYYLNPSIISGSCAYMAPEKAGIWAYPYPVSFYEKSKEADLFDEEYVNCRADGEETVFNMVNALCGTLYLSGRIDKADENNTKLIKEGVEVFKRYRSHICKAYPVWPKGMQSIADRTCSSLGFISEDRKRMTLAVWKLEDRAEVIEVNLSKYFAGRKVRVELIYPSSIFTEFVYNVNSGILSVRMLKNRTARFFEIVLE